MSIVCTHYPEQTSIDNAVSQVESFLRLNKDIRKAIEDECAQIDNNLLPNDVRFAMLIKRFERITAKHEFDIAAKIFLLELLKQAYGLTQVAFIKSQRAFKDLLPTVSTARNIGIRAYTSYKRDVVDLKVQDLVDKNIAEWIAKDTNDPHGKTYKFLLYAEKIRAVNNAERKSITIDHALELEGIEKSKHDTAGEELRNWDDIMNNMGTV